MGVTHDATSSVATFWVAASAVATFLLALCTVWLALQARREAKAVEVQGKHVIAQAKATQATAEAMAEQAATTAGQLEITRRAFRASIQPLLTIGSPEKVAPPVDIVDREGEGTPFGIYAFVTVLNVGSGLAVIRPEESKILGWGPEVADLSAGPREFATGAVANPVLPAGEERTIEFIIPRSGSSLDVAAFTHQRIGSMRGTDGEFYADIVYGDAMNESKTLARFHFAFVKGSGWVTNSVAYFSPPEAIEADIVARMR